MCDTPYYTPFDQAQHDEGTAQINPESWAAHTNRRTHGHEGQRFRAGLSIEDNDDLFQDANEYMNPHRPRPDDKMPAPAISIIQEAFSHLLLLMYIQFLATPLLLLLLKGSCPNSLLSTYTSLSTTVPRFT